MQLLGLCKRSAARAAARATRGGACANGAGRMRWEALRCRRACKAASRRSAAEGIWDWMTARCPSRTRDGRPHDGTDSGLQPGCAAKLGPLLPAMSWSVTSISTPSDSMIAASRSSPTGSLCGAARSSLSTPPWFPRSTLAVVRAAVPWSGAAPRTQGQGTHLPGAAALHRCRLVVLALEVGDAGAPKLLSSSACLRAAAPGPCLARCGQPVGQPASLKRAQTTGE